MTTYSLKLSRVQGDDRGEVDDSHVKMSIFWASF